MKYNLLSIALVFFIFIGGYTFMDVVTSVKPDIKELKASSHSWVLEPYQYVLTLDDSFWVTVRHADGTIVGQVWCDTTTQIGKLFYHDNE